MESQIWIYEVGNPLDPHRYSNVPVKVPGRYRCYIHNQLVKMTGCAIFNILSFRPIGFSILSASIMVETYDEVLSGICCITHIAKLLGPHTEWEGRLRVSHEAAYNMIHLTPIQQFGSSQSAFSISDHLSLCDCYLPADYKPRNVSVTYTGMS